MTTSGRPAVSPFAVFLLHGESKGLIAPDFPRHSCKKVQNRPSRSPEMVQSARMSGESCPPTSNRPVAITSRFHQLKPPTTQRGRRLFSCVGHSLDTSRAPPRRTSAASATRWISTPSKPSHQDPRRVHPWPLCPNSCTYAAPQAHAPIKSHRIRKARPSTLIHHFPRRDQAEPVCCGLPTCHKYVAHGSLPYFQR